MRRWREFQVGTKLEFKDGWRIRFWHTIKKTGKRGLGFFMTYIKSSFFARIIVVDNIVQKSLDASPVMSILDLALGKLTFNPWIIQISCYRIFLF